MMKDYGKFQPLDDIQQGNDGYKWQLQERDRFVCFAACLIIC